MAIDTTQERLSIMSMGRPWMPPAYLPTGSANRPVSAWLYAMTYGTGVVRLWAPFTLIFTGLSTNELVFAALSDDSLIYTGLSSDSLVYAAKGTDSLVFTGYSTDEIVKGG